MLVVDAPSEDEVRRRLAEDPWQHSGHLTIASVERWQVLLDSPAAAISRRAGA